MIEEDKDYPPEYYLDQEEEFDEFEDANEDYKDNSIFLDGIEEQWNQLAPILFIYYLLQSDRLFRTLLNTVQQLLLNTVHNCKTQSLSEGMRLRYSDYYCRMGLKRSSSFVRPFQTRLGCCQKDTLRSQLTTLLL